MKIFQAQELGCDRYAGSDRAILRRLPAEDCDYHRPDLKWKWNHFPASGEAPRFALSASKGGILGRLGRSCVTDLEGRTRHGIQVLPEQIDSDAVAAD
jgi:hypothetical protein